MREQLRAKQTACEQASLQAAEQWQKAQELRERTAGQQAGLQQQHAQMQERLQQAEQQWQQALADSEFADETAFAAALLDDALRRRLQQRKEQLQQRQVEAAALLAQATQTLEQHRQNRPEGTDEANADLDALTQSLAELAQQLKALQLSGASCATSWKATPPAVSINRRCSSKSPAASKTTTTGATSTS